MAKGAGKDGQNLWVRYALGMALIIFLLSVSHVMHLRVQKAGELDAQIINISGQQRMLSQRILLLSGRLQTDPDQEVVDLLTAAIDRFADNHVWLLGHAVHSETTLAQYHGRDGADLNAKSERYIAMARSLLVPQTPADQAAAIYAKLDALALNTLLRDLDAAVKIFETEARERAVTLTRLQELSLICAVLLILAETLLIFYPAHRQVMQALGDARTQQDKLHRKNEDLAATGERLERVALQDPLTGLANRKRLYAELSDRMVDPRIDQSKLCVMHIDLDRFKEVNDTLGHPVGDEVLRRTAKAMQASVRASDLVARIGGDEFVILLDLGPTGGTDRAQSIAETIIARVREPFVIEDRTCAVGASVGYTFGSDGATTADAMISNADIALYEAKRAGKGIAVPFVSGMRAAMEERRTLSADIDRGLKNQEFVPFFQPQVALDTGAVVGFEVLTRWAHPQRGILTPGVFIELAEETGLIHDIDAHIMLAGLDALTDLRERGWSNPAISLNVSPRTLRQPDFCSDLLMAITMRRLKPQDVIIEVVETSLIEGHDDVAARTVSELTQMGVRVHIDDFGTGYASLSTLATLDITGLKIDQTLVADLDNPKSSQVVRAIIQLAQSMNLTTTAEGIETPKQFATLKKLGCLDGQGYAIGYPSDQSDTLKWLKDYGRPTGDIRA